MPTMAPEITKTEQPVMSTDNGDHDKFAHIVPKATLTDAYVFGTPTEALCGKKWVPHRDPERFPVCPDCKKKLAGILSNHPEN